MSKVFFTSDTHFGHQRTFDYSKRSMYFKDVEDIDAYIEEFTNAFKKETGEKPEISDIVKDIPNFRYSEHSGNTLSASWLMFVTYKNKPEMVKFLHGSLAPLVGDNGYYDNREDVKEYLKEHGI